MYVEHFRARVLQDALNEATRWYWIRRVEQFAAAMPRRGDFPGQRIDAERGAKLAELAEIVQACRIRAGLAPLSEIGSDVVAVLREVA